jgi:hypothetical protein
MHDAWSILSAGTVRNLNGKKLAHCRLMSRTQFPTMACDNIFSLRPVRFRPRLPHTTITSSVRRGVLGEPLIVVVPLGKGDRGRREMSGPSSVLVSRCFGIVRGGFT